MSKDSASAIMVLFAVVSIVYWFICLRCKVILDDESKKKTTEWGKNPNCGEVESCAKQSRRKNGGVHSCKKIIVQNDITKSILMFNSTATRNRERSFPFVVHGAATFDTPYCSFLFEYRYRTGLPQRLFLHSSEREKKAGRHVFVAACFHSAQITITRLFNLEP